MDQEVRHRDRAFFARLVADKQGLSFEAAELFIQELFQLLKEGLIKDNYVHLKGLGTFKIINIEDLPDDAKTTHKLLFVPDGELQSIINKPFEHFESVVIYSDELKEQFKTEKMVEKEETRDEALPEEEAVNANREEKQAVDEDQGKEISPKGGQAIQMKKIEDSFIDIYGTDEEELSADDMSLTETEEDMMEAKNQEQEEISVESKKIQPKGQNSSTIWALSFIIVVLGLLVLLLAFRLQSVQKELNAYVSQRTEWHTLERGKEEAIILYPDTTVTTDSLSNISREATEETLNPVGTAKPIGQYDIPSRESLPYAIVGTLTTHQVAPGETLRILAEVYYGSRDMWPYIYYYNESLVKKPDQLLKNTVLKIPKLDNFQRQD